MFIPGGKGACPMGFGVAIETELAAETVDTESAVVGRASDRLG
jgi:hypothetical protein